MDKHKAKSLKCILMVFMSPIALLILVLLALLNLLRFLFKVALLFVIVAITTPFAVMYNVSILVVEYYGAHFQQSIADFKKPIAPSEQPNAPSEQPNAPLEQSHAPLEQSHAPSEQSDASSEQSDASSEESDASSGKTTASDWNWSDPRASVGTDVQILVSDFLKTVAAEFLVAVSTGVITFYTSPDYVFYISTTVGVAVVFHKWLNTDCLSKTALACLCGGYGLNPMMVLFSFIGLFDIGCHPVAKCSFTAHQAFLFVEDGTYVPEDCLNPFHDTNMPLGKMSHWEPRPNDGHKEKTCHHRFSGMAWSNVEQAEYSSIDSFKWNAFERGLLQLSPKIEFINRNLAGKYVLESFMVLKFLDQVICEYPMERLELPEDYSKPNELYHFLVILSSNDAFVTDKMRGRYEHSSTLLQIAEGVEKNFGFKIVYPKENLFVVAGCTN